MSERIDAMVSMVQDGYTPRSVWEGTLSLHPGSSAKVNKATTGMDPQSGASVSVPEGSMVTIVGVGAGDSGVDHLVQLDDGKKIVIPHADLGESELVKVEAKDDPDMKKYECEECGAIMESGDAPGKCEECGSEKMKLVAQKKEELTGAVAKITLAKPLPQSAMDWVSGGYMDYAVELPETPMDDSAKEVSFLMKAEDEDMLAGGVEALKKAAGSSFKSSAPSTMVDWSGMVMM